MCLEVQERGNEEGRGIGEKEEAGRERRGKVSTIKDIGKDISENSPLSQTPKGQPWTRSPVNPPEIPLPSRLIPGHSSKPSLLMDQVDSAALETGSPQPQPRLPLPAAFPPPVWGLGQATSCSRRRKQFGRGAPSLLAPGCPASMISMITICSSSTGMKTCVRGGRVNTHKPAKQQLGSVIS